MESVASHHAAIEAISLVCQGEQVKGVDRYRACLQGHLRDLPVGLHVRMLRDAGFGEAAGTITELALRRGADLTTGRFLRSAPLEDSAVEYERLFLAGSINSWMVSRYLLVLAQLGRHAEMAGILDADRLIKVIRLDVPFHSDAQEPVVSALQRAILQRESEAVYEESTQSVRQMHKLQSLQSRVDPAFAALVTAVRSEVSRMIKQWSPGEGPIASWLPSEFQIDMWALTSRGTGFNTRHVHPRGWYTGVFYVTGLPDTAGSGGVLRVGRPDKIAMDAPGWPEVEIRPEPGLLVLMPSYFTHWTEPLGRPGLRISVPFDVLDGREAE